MPYKEGKKWRGKVYLNGKAYTKMCQTKSEAKDWERNKLKELKLGKDPEIDMPLTSLVVNYLDFCKLHFINGVYLEKRLLSKRFLGFCGDILVSQVDSGLVLTYLDKQANMRSANGYNVDRKNLSAMWNYGTKFLGLKSNPVSKIPKLPHEPAPQYVPPPGDVLKLIAAATPEERIVIDCCLCTGARRSEVFRLRWHEDIDFQNRKLRLGTRKTKDGSMEYTWVEMNDVLYKSLWWWWNHRPIKDSPWVFVNTERNQWHGTPFTNQRRFMRRICKRAQVKPFGFHALRRFVGSYLADIEKVSIKRIQQILRHKSHYTTERYVKGLTGLKETYKALENIYTQGDSQENENEKKST